MAGWNDHPDFGSVWDSGCVPIIDDPSMPKDPIPREWMRDEKFVAIYSPDARLRRTSGEFHKDRVGTAVREAELEDWDEQAETLRCLLS